jgi:hypothetical protein
MTTTTQDGGSENPMPGSSSLDLIKIPFAFSQDGLLTTAEIITQARERGSEIDLDLLQKLHETGALLPLYRVDDIPVEADRIDVAGYDGHNVRGWVLLAAAEGRLRDPAHEGYSAEWPYQLPADERPDRWWNGFAYSPWQLLELGHAINTHRAIAAGWLTADDLALRPQNRRLVLALASLATPYLPRVLGRLRLPTTLSETELRRFRARADTQELLRLGAFAPSNLSQAADNLLLSAHSADPLQKWVKLLRYASFDGWSKLRGEPLACMWRRAAAEILLLAHEDLAAQGVLQPLPDLTGASWHAPQHDRLNPRYSEAETLERALAELGLSPHPRVILLVEGKTELHHIRRLLTELSFSRPQDVRVQACHGSKVNAHLIARYGITPRIGRRVSDSWLLDASPTALVLAMDPEHKFSTAEGRDTERRNLQEAIRHEVRYQDADISQEDLDVLVSVHVWGDDKYELANFTDDELMAAIAQLAARHNHRNAGSPGWETQLRGHLQEARRLHLDISAPLGQVGAPKDKLELAELLWPVLLAKCEQELAADHVTTPVLRILMKVHSLVAKVSGVFAVQVPLGFAPDE